MKDKLKGLVVGVVIGSLVTGGAAFAASGKMIEVFYGVNDIKVNKVSKMPADNKPFLYNGTTYVPLAFIGKELGQSVKWDGKTKTIYIGETEEKGSVYPGNGIEAMNLQTTTNYHEIKYVYDSAKMLKDNIGNEYSSFISFYQGGWARPDDVSTIEFPLNGQFKTFKAKVGLTDSYKSTFDTMIIKIFADEKEVYSNKVKAGDMPSDLSVSVEGAAKIIIKVTSDPADSDSELALFDAHFTK